jgi:hypothetical protein
MTTILITIDRVRLEKPYGWTKFSLEAAMTIFVFPDDVVWNDGENQLEFTVGVGEYAGKVRVALSVFRRAIGQPLTPEACIALYHLQRTAFERTVECKVKLRQLSGDGNIDLDGRDLRLAGMTETSVMGGDWG